MTSSRQRHESQAAELLGSLRGYMSKAGWRHEDIRLVADILQEWDEQVTGLLDERAGLKRRIGELSDTVRWQEWRLAGQGWGRYLKFLLGVRACP